MQGLPDNRAIHDRNWRDWSEMKLHGPASRWLQHLIAENLKKVETEKIFSVLDLGCGQGANTALLAAVMPHANVRGTDFSRAGIELANQLFAHPNLVFDVDAESSALSGAGYDLLTCFEVLEHVEDWQSLLGRICSASRRYVMLSFPTGRMRPFERHMGHMRNFRRGEVEDFMAQKGFVASNIFYAGFPFYSPIYRELCDAFNIGQGEFVRGQWGLQQRFASALLYFLFRHASCNRRGDQFCGLFERDRMLDEGVA